MKTCRLILLTFLVFALSAASQGQISSVMFPGGGNVRIDDAPQLDITGTISLEAWIYPVAKPNSWPVIVSKSLDVLEAPWDAYALGLTDEAEGQQHAYFQLSNGSTFVSVATASTIPLFTWTHLAATYNGDSLRIYMNGILNGSYYAPGFTTQTSNSHLSIGRRNLAVSNQFRGFIDDVRVWNVARSEPAIQSNLTQLSPGDRTGLAGFWKFDADTGTTAFDSSGFGNNGVLRLNTLYAAFSPQSVTAGAQIALDPVSINFGTVEQYQPATVGVNITNNGTGVLVGYVKKGGASIGVASTYLFYISPSSPIPVPFIVRPLESGAVSDIITVTNNAGDPVSVPVSGNAIAVRRFDANAVGMWTLRNGQFAYDPLQTPSIHGGLEWPRGSNLASVYASGVWLGAMVDGQVRVTTAHYASSFMAGPIAGGLPANPQNIRYRVYKINAGDNSSNNIDFAEWPADLGAPTNPDGSPLILGDQTLWTVYNDADSVARNTSSTFLPLGAEVQQTTFGFADPNSPINDVVFVRFKIVNKSPHVWQNAYVGLWADPDLGYFGDDVVASDSLRGLGIVYNLDNDDEGSLGGYGLAPPAVGYMFLQEGGASPLNAFAYHAAGDPNLADPVTAGESYNYLRGLRRDGSPYINPVTGQPTRYAFSGDPVSGAGWIDPTGSDKRFTMSTGPFDLGPGESREIFAAIMMARGPSNIESIVHLRQLSDLVRELFRTGLENAPQLLSAKDIPNDQGGRVQLVWKASTLDRDLRILPYYSIWRALPMGATMSGREVKMHDVPAGFKGPAYTRVEGSPDLAWEWLENFPSHRFSMYAYSAETLFDSMSTTNGKHYFLVAAHTPDPNVFYNSNVDSGYSKDNLAPTAPGGLRVTVASGIPTVRFNANEEPDVAEYLIYRGLSPNVDVSGPPLAAVRDTFYTDAAAPQGTTVYYAVRAKDVHENVGPKSAEVSTMTTGVTRESGVPTNFALHQNHPNPFNPSTSIRFAVPERSHVRIAIYNSLGQEVTLLVDGEFEVGTYGTDWRPTNLTSGIYVCRMQAGKYVESRKVVLLK